MPMVRDGEKPRRELAACWSVEVVNGGRGERLTSLSVTSLTNHEPERPFLSMFSVDDLSSGSSSQVILKTVLLFPKTSAVMMWYVSLLKEFISLSRSTRIRSAGD